MIREPKFAHYPKNMKFPKPVQKQIKVVEGLTAAWAEEDAEYAVRQHALSEAKSRDAEALKVAAIAGEKDPGTKATDEAARPLLYQEERVRAVRDSEARRNEGLAPLRWVASLTDSSLSYDPNFPIEGGFQLPRTSEQKVLGIVALLRKFFVDSAEEAA